MVSAGGRTGQHQTAAHRLAVEAHGARAALALLAGVLGPGQAEALPEDEQQALARSGIDDGAAGAVDHHGELPVGRHEATGGTPGKDRRRARRASTPPAWRR